MKACSDERMEERDMKRQSKRGDYANTEFETMKACREARYRALLQKAYEVCKDGATPTENQLNLGLQQLETSYQNMRTAEATGKEATCPTLRHVYLKKLCGGREGLKEFRAAWKPIREQMAATEDCFGANRSTASVPAPEPMPVDSNNVVITPTSLTPAETEQ